MKNYLEVKHREEKKRFYLWEKIVGLLMCFGPISYVFLMTKQFFRNGYVWIVKLFVKHRSSFFYHNITDSASSYEDPIKDYALFGAESIIHIVLWMVISVIAIIIGINMIKHNKKIYNYYLFFLVFLPLEFSLSWLLTVIFIKDTEFLYIIIVHILLGPFFIPIWIVFVLLNTIYFSRIIKRESINI